MGKNTSTVLDMQHLCAGSGSSSSSIRFFSQNYLRRCQKLHSQKKKRMVNLLLPVDYVRDDFFSIGLTNALWTADWWPNERGELRRALGMATHLHILRRSKTSTADETRRCGESSLTKDTESNSSLDVNGPHQQLAQPPEFIPRRTKTYPHPLIIQITEFFHLLSTVNLPVLGSVVWPPSTSTHLCLPPALPPPLSLVYVCVCIYIYIHLCVCVCVYASTVLLSSHLFLLFF